MLIKLAKPAASLKLFRSRIRAPQSGGYLSRTKGRGMEFDEVRMYQPGDDIRSIDWRVTARTGKLTPNYSAKNVNARSLSLSIIVPLCSLRHVVYLNRYRRQSWLGY